MPIDLSRMVRPPAIKLYYEQPEDDSSTSSTLLVDDQHSSSSKNTHTYSSKHVRFSTAPSQYYEHPIEYTEELIARCWYQPDDIKTFRSNTVETSKRVVAIEKRNRAPFSYQRVLERTFEACTEVTSEEAAYDDHRSVLATSEKEHLQRWLEVANSRIGIEKLCIHKIAREKTMRRCTLNRIMRNEKKLQQQQQKNREPVATIDASNDDAQEQHDRSEHLRETCARVSRPCRVFARTMAEALAVVVREENKKYYAPSASSCRYAAATKNSCTLLKKREHDESTFAWIICNASSCEHYY